MGPLLPVLVYLPVLALFGAVSTKLVARWEWPVYVAGGLFLWTFIEYLMHRYIFHYPVLSPRLQEIQAGMHLAHHDAPEDAKKIVARPLFSLTIATAIWGILFAAFRRVDQASLVMAGVIVGYLFYEFVHYAVHTRADGGPILRAWRRYHFYHHFQNGARCFGVTSPLWDVVFRTGRVT